MTRRFLVAATLVLAVGGLGTLPLLAQAPGQRMGGAGRGGRGGPGGPALGLMPLLQRLNLTDQQREQVQQVMEDNRPAPDAMQQLREADQNLYVSIFGDAPNPQAIDGLKTTINAAHAAELEHQIEMMAKIAQILTPDQRQQLLKLQAEGPSPGRGRAF